MSLVREFILNATEKFFSLPTQEVKEKNDEALMNFIHNSQTLVLQIFIDSGSSLFFFTKIQEGVKKSIIFYKTSAQELTSQDSLNSINIITLNNGAAESLYQILRQIYSPLLAVGEDLYSNKLQKNLSDLQANLRVLTHGKEHENTKVILSIEDEIDYWKTMGQQRDANKKEREAASSFCVLFEDIFEEIRSLQTSVMQEVKDSAENIAGILDDVWRYTVHPYSEDRMIHIFDIIGHVICSVIQKAVSQIDPWKIHDGYKDNEILVLMTDGLIVVQTWIGACKSLTDTYWPNYALHPWKGKPYIPNFCINFETRLKEIHNIRSTYNQLVKLLTENEKAELSSHQFLEPFKNINVWIYNGPNQSWESAVATFSAKIRPAESKIIEKLKPRMNNTSTKQMLYEFIRYKTLINRPLVKHALSNELDIFVSSLLAMLKTIRSQMDSDEVDVQMSQPAEMSPLVQRVQWAKQMEAKVKEVVICIENYLGEFENSEEVLKLASQLLRDLKTTYTQLHEDWSRDIQALVRDESAAAGDGPVVRFSREERLMEVRFEPRLVRAESEARALAALALAPPAALRAALAALTAPLAHARALHQVASFHNTLGERMIPSTRPMMLQAALELAALVQDDRPLYWHDEEKLIDYTERLKRVVLKLEGQNTYLTGQHLCIRSIIVKLMDTDLLAKQSEWKKGIKDIRDIIEKVEANGYKNTDMWRSHWDFQLYKTLEYQYIKTLLALHKHFPKVRVDMVLRDRTVRLQPPLEEIRVQHYSQLRRLVSLPNHFVGLRANIADEKSIFASIVENHGWLGNRAVRSLEAALRAARGACARWARRAALACVRDLDALCALHLRRVADWEDNFKACKALGQAVAKMPFDDEKIEWITIGTATLRREFEAQTRNLWTCLMSSLQASCRDDAVTLDSFMANATVMLEDKTLPKNAKELAEISSKQQALQEQMPEMEKTVEDLKRKGYLLRTWGGDSSFDNTIRDWEKLREQILSQREMFNHQAEIVKAGLKGSWKNLHGEVEAWVSRCGRLERAPAAPRQRARDGLRAAALGQRLLAERAHLAIECEKFNLNVENSDTWKEAERLTNDLLNLWTVLKDYDDELEELAGQEWIIFQKKLHLLDDFVAKWNSQLEPYTTATLYIKQELENYFDLTTALKYIRGTDFTENHWREVFSLIELEYVKPETLLVKDLLKVGHNIKKQMKALQKISAAASSEATIRCALNELELWFAGARLALVQRADQAQRRISIVTNYKELMAKVEEQQWVVSSAGAAGAAGAAGGAWAARLGAALRLARAAHHAQRRWLYLEPILSNADGELGLKFRKVDQGFRQVARIIESDPRLSTLLQSTRLQAMLDTISEQLNACQSALNDYIDDKRLTFPRLYFLSDDDLLELLGQARTGAEGRETVMQSHLKKLFPGITGVHLGPGGLSITSLCSHFGETFQLDHPVDVDCSVELWLKNLEQEIRSSLKNMTLKCLVANSLQDQDPFSLPTQILCLGQNIRFTEQTERAITSKELHKLRDIIEKENLYYAAAETEDECEKYKKQALILQCSYYVSVVQNLIENNVVTTGDWLWQKQLRFYLQDNTEVVAKMGLAQISYSYEYLGVNTGQFVRTDTTDESFLILTQSLHLGLVGNPIGPAGTGKTESVKALGCLFGRLVLVFNCDEAMDAECMGRLLTGVALCGAWGCFDEFNRLSSATLAVVSHQFASLLAAMRRVDPTGDRTALLNGKQVVVSEWCGVAATMNPATRGYGGRRSLPPALQHALRPLALRPPPRAELAARLLAASAAQPHLQPEQLADDLDAVFTLASTLLSAQRHYDWGLRALKAAVGGARAALRGAGGARAARAALRGVLRLNNLSKLTRPDAHCFENILAMVFADVPEEQSTTDPLYLALENTVQRLGLVNNKLQVQKCMELYEQLQQRMGVAIVGPPGSGKSTIRQILKSALTYQGKNVVEYVICPKAMSRSWLLGHVELDTRQWTDGVLTAVALEVANQPEDVWSWVVCDGDIDPEWIEALNSVLDDNRLLTLPSGWRVQFGQNVNFIFETHSLEYASPATISRMGIILFSAEIHCSQEILDSWVQKKEFDNETTKLAVSFLNQTVNKCLKWLNVHRADVTTQDCHMSLVRQILANFEYISQEITFENSSQSAEDMVWSAVQLGTMGIIKRNAIDSFYEELEMPLPAGAAGAAGALWAEGVLRGARVRACERAVRAAAHAVVVGPEGSAKTLIAEFILRESNSTVITINCTPNLEPADIIAELKRKNAVGGAGRGAGPVLLVRALHRARCDAWGSSPVHSFLLQVIQQHGFWSREEGAPQWQATGRVRALCTAERPPRARLAAALAHVHLPEADDEELLELSRSYLSESVPKNVNDNDISNLSRNMIALYKEVIETFHSKSHYKWNPSHLKQWCDNIKWFSPNDLQQVITALNAMANIIFKNRLVTDEEKSEYNTLAQNYFKTDHDVYFIPKLRNDGVYLVHADYKEWYENTQKLINQCLTDDENCFGESGIEVCAELSVLCPAIALALNGGGASCAGGAGAGRRAAARLLCGAVGARLALLDQAALFHTSFKNALTLASEGTRTLIVLCEPVVTHDLLACVEAYLCATFVHAIPTSIVPSFGPTQQTEQTFINMKKNIGILICLDKDQDNLTELLDSYPLLYNNNFLCWVSHWSDETLKDMPAQLIQRLSKENALEMSQDDMKSIPVQGFVDIYKSLDADRVRTPSRYMHFIKTYNKIFNTKKQALQQRRDTLCAGVEALRRARSEVATLQDEAAEQEVALSEKQAKANQALDQIGATVRATTDKKEEMYQLKKNIEMENEKLQIQKKEIEEELASVEPVIAAARAAVGDIQPESLSEVRSLRAPPDVVRDVLEGVLRLMGIADTSWHSMKSFLSKRGVKEDIRCLDARQISPEAVQSVERLLQRRGASFEQAAARRASAACAPLAAWVRANLDYARALARVRPLQDRQRQLHGNLKRAEDELAALSSGLATVDERVAALKEQLGRHTREAAAIELRLSTAVQTIRAASDLLDRLAHEYDSWENDLQNITIEILDLNQRTLLAAGYLTFLPDLTEPQARNCLSKWCSLISFEDTSFSLINFLSTPESQLKWEANGLPLDQSAFKNAVYIDQYLEHSSALIPLLIDPEGEAEVWLRSTLAHADFVPQHEPRLATALHLALKLGRTLVITEVECIEEWWWSTMRGAGAGRARVLLATRRPALLSGSATHVRAALAPLHFTARLHALVDQLVRGAFYKQNPEMKEKSKEIKLTKATLQKRQLELQENLLRDLSGNADILHDANLLAALEKTRSTSATIAQALGEARALEAQTRAACEAYAPSATRAATLALSARLVAALPPDALLDVFVGAVARSENDPQNINNDEVVKYFTRRIIERVLLSLHKKDKYIVVMHLLRQVYDDLIPEKLWRIFIENFNLIDDKELTSAIKNQFQWIREDCVKKVAQIKVQDQNLYNRLSLEKSDMWLEFQKFGDLHVLSKLNLEPFECVVAVAALRPESTYRAIVSFVDQILGAGALPGAQAAQRAARWSRPARPALLLAAHAHDVLVAHAHAHSRTLTTVGIDEGRIVWDAALETSRGGSWLAIRVGASPFTRDLLSFVVSLSEKPASDFSDEFRLWILAEDRDIPSTLSTTCVKVILESPEGVKRNACGTLSAWTRLRADAPLLRHLAGLALFHALVQERRAYIPHGWSQWYGWEWGDVSAGAAAARAAGGGQAARELCGALYEARVERARDRSVLRALARGCLREPAPAPPAPWPRSDDVQDYITAMETLPDIDTPELLHLPANCRVAWEKNAADNIIEGLRELNSTVNIKTSDNTTSVKTLLSLWKKMMSGSPLIKADYHVERARGWWGAVCASELHDAARAARALHAALAALARLRAPLHKVPDEWQLLWSGPTAPEAYINEFCHRARAALERVDVPESSEDYMPAEVDLRQFFRPARVLCAARAREAARRACSLQALALVARWDGPAAEAAGDVRVRGVSLGGGAWRAGRVCAAPAAAPPHAPAPPLQLRYVPAIAGGQAAIEHGFEIPLYTNEFREEELARVSAPLHESFAPRTALLHALALFVAPLQ
ncbi:cytoplasmic dynein 2 heavy chain 1 [Nymphalis io]|uniref:cytoplasmic dynein 2 heavy chain 1 n=1 Tax=Inachis io TaxID=171585 RepID=UPI002169E766|nr:cytoplasmic dynein 2 heavy chain 1 [Nymphalis io]